MPRLAHADRSQLRGLLAPGEPADLLGVPSPTALRGGPAGPLRTSLSGQLQRFDVTRVSYIGGLDRLRLPVYVAARPQGLTLSGASGKGLDRDAAWVSAVMEAAEQHVWEGLQPSDVIASEGALRSLGAAVAEGSTLPRRVGTRWTTDLPVRWREGWDVVSGTSTFVPDALVAAVPDPMSPFVTGTNGLASGTHVLEALLSALLEVVERDGVTWARTAGEAAGVDPTRVLATVAPPLAEALTRSGTIAEVFDATTELGIPTFVCHLSDGGDGIGTSFGAGAALSPAVALVRSVVEAVQSRTVMVAGARDDVFFAERRSATLWPQEVSTRPPLDCDLRGQEGARSIADEVDMVLQRLSDSGFDQVVAFRHTAPGEQVQVVRVVVPGLEGYPATRHALGRRAEGWLGRRDGRSLR